jgi:hypothetical protein
VCSLLAVGCCAAATARRAVVVVLTTAAATVADDDDDDLFCALVVLAAAVFWRGDYIELAWCLLFAWFGLVCVCFFVVEKSGKITL